MKRVLHIAPGFLYGGIESLLVDWNSLMNRDRVHFDVVKVTPDEPNPMVNQLKGHGAQVFSIPPLKPGSLIAHRNAMKKVLLEGHYDAVHSHDLAYGLIPLRMAKSLGIKRRILHSHTTSDNPGAKHQRVIKVLSALSLHYVTDFFACSEEAGIAAFGKRRKFTVIRNGIFLNQFAFYPEVRDMMRKRYSLDGKFVIGTIARFSTQKNILFLLDIFHEFQKLTTNTKLVLVGDGPEMGKITHKISALNLADSVLLPGRQENVNEWLQCFDAFLMPSHFEGFGITALEAQASGLPCYLSDIITRAVDVTGTVVYIPLGKSARAWADIMISSYGEPRQPGKIDMIREAGYDIRTTAKWLEEYYLKNP